MHLTYRQLANKIMEPPKERLDDDVTIFDCETDEYFPVQDVELVSDQSSVLDDGHMVLVFKIEE